jgi:hypothetical protein
MGKRKVTFLQKSISHEVEIIICDFVSFKLLKE